MEKAPENLSTISFEWEAAFNALTDPVSIHDNQFRIVKINSALASLLSEKPENILGKKCHQVIHGTDKPVELCPHVQALLTSRSRSAAAAIPYARTRTQACSSSPPISPGHSDPRTISGSRGKSPL